jgi:hypothetical protein
MLRAGDLLLYDTTCGPATLRSAGMCITSPRPAMLRAGEPDAAGMDVDASACVAELAQAAAASEDLGCIEGFAGLAVSGSPLTSNALNSSSKAERIQRAALQP